MHQRAEAELRENVQRNFSFAVKLGFQSPQATTARNFDQLGNENFGNVAPAIIWMRQQRDQSDVTFPSTDALMERRLADDFLSMQHQQRKVALIIRMTTPVANRVGVGHRLLDE